VESIKTQSEKVNILTQEDVIELHELLSKNYDLIRNMDAVEPPGIKSKDLLISAVQRQHVGLDTWYKYDTCFSNCATLVFGIIKNHSFNNGNKRTGLLCMIKHLFINNYVLKPELKHEDIYKLIIAISDDALVDFATKHKIYKKWIRQNKIEKHAKLEMEKAVNFIAFWLKKNSISKNVAIKSKVKIGYLKSLLEKKNINLEQSGAKINIYRLVDKKIFGIPIGKKKLNEKEYSLGTSLTEIGSNTLNILRKDFQLTQQDGIDNVIFYDDESFIDEEITTYRKIIYKLAKT
jgi:death-on-curing protein